MPIQFTDRLNNVVTSAIRELFKLLDKPGMMLIPPGEKRVLTHRIRVC